jgi:hypothetical protein
MNAHFYSLELNFPLSNLFKFLQLICVRLQLILFDCLFRHIYAYLTQQ